MILTTLSAAVTATGLAGMISKDGLDEFVGALLELVDDGVVEGILVLLEPSSKIVRYSTGVMDNGEVRFRLTGLGGLGLDEARRLAEMVGIQLFSEGLVSGLGEHRLFLKDGENTQGLEK